MLSKTVLETQTVVELPAREMLAWSNVAVVGATQLAGNGNTQLNLLGLFQLNAASQSNANVILVGQG
jgi:hypothetical protein